MLQQGLQPHIKPQPLAVAPPATSTSASSPLRHRKGDRLRAGAQTPQRQQQQEVQLGNGSAVPRVMAAAPDWPLNPAFLVAASGGFTAVTSDLFAPGGARWLLNAIDQPVHGWVVEHIPRLVRDLVFEIGVSNVAITLGCVGWALTTSILLSDFADSLQGSKKAEGSEAAVGNETFGAVTGSLAVRNVTRLAAAWALYWSAGGFLVPGDNLLVASIKHICSRTRPSTRHKSFSFPSGHTTAVTFIVGMLLFAMLPWLLELVEARSKSVDKVSKLGVLKVQAVQKLVSRMVANGGKLWSGAVASTAVGRVLGDVHWVSDTLAGACLGAALVSGFLIITRNLESRSNKNL